MRPGVVVLGGLPGAGKTVLAAALAHRLPGARVLDRDQVGHALFAPCDDSSAERDVTFSAMLDAASYHVGRGRVVIFDGLTFSRRSEVEAAEAAATEAGGFSAVVVCDVPVSVAIERCEAAAAAARAAGGRPPAAIRDGDLVRRVAAEIEEPPGAYLTVDTTSDPDTAAAQALAYVKEQAG
ncbi:MAG TPA: AAA family ATPase [Acidimicrobiales bacterium]|nr:AAA family ATPase [Acidimicrobiales bacterium]